MASKIKYKQSSIHGKGIFSIQEIKEGEIVCIIKGRRMFKINKNEKDALAHPNWVGFKINNWVDPVPPYKYLNHSCKPNTAIKGSKTLVALKNIEKDEEITIDYSIIEADPRWYMKCHCGNNNCRGIIKSIQFLPDQTYSRYLPNISKEFQKIHEGNREIR